MGKTRYDYLDIPYLYQMILGQIPRVIEIQWAQTLNPLMKTSVWQQLNIHGFISRTNRQKIALQWLRYVKYRFMVISFIDSYTKAKWYHFFCFLFTLFNKLADLFFFLFHPGCDVGFYGENCSKTCGLCNSGTCDIVTGQCDELGCALPGFQASACIGTL